MLALNIVFNFCHKKTLCFYLLFLLEIFIVFVLPKAGATSDQLIAAENYQRYLNVHR